MTHDAAFMLRVLRRYVDDPRVHNQNNPKISLYGRFPYKPMPEDPKVARHCAKSFISCVSYLSKVSRQIRLSSRYDKQTRVKGEEQGLCDERGRFRIFCEYTHTEGGEFYREIYDFNEVVTLLANESLVDKYRRFSQLMTAQHYMCWYTMHQVAYLQDMIQCDSTTTGGKPDWDFRADPSVPFGCALYSFCPNPCCSKI
ncbi:uncharacterized protein [Panulirus ornatus]|uniref:uncharacterized protein n=1 Tax=Panulirus ornatus TaxID=150431 RepID=UPI003A86D645